MVSLYNPVCRNQNCFFNGMETWYLMLESHFFNSDICGFEQMGVAISEVP